MFLKSCRFSYYSRQTAGHADIFRPFVDALATVKQLDNGFVHFRHVLDQSVSYH